jgi:hypothetical protein
MKRKIIYLAFSSVILCLLNTSAFSQWRATLHAEGEKIEGQTECDVLIGVESKAVSIEAPPSPPPIYTVHMMLYQMDWNGPFFTDIRKEGENKYSWFISINPHGTASVEGTDTGETTRSSVISWNPDDFGKGSFQLQEGYDLSGPIAVSDMKSITSYTITGKDEYYYFILTYTPDEDPPETYTLSNLITILQVLSENTQEKFMLDINGDQKTGMAEAIYIFKSLGKI